MTRGRWLLLIAVVAFLASLCGVLAARHVFVAERPSETEVHKLLHEQLKLSPEQHSKIEALEKQHAIRKRAMELEMRAANARLSGSCAALSVTATPHSILRRKPLFPGLPRSNAMTLSARFGHGCRASRSTRREIGRGGVEYAASSVVLSILMKPSLLPTNRRSLTPSFFTAPNWRGR